MKVKDLEKKYYHFKDNLTPTVEFIGLITEMDKTMVYFRPIVFLHGEGSLIPTVNSKHRITELFTITEIEYNGKEKENYPEFLI